MAASDAFSDRVLRVRLPGGNVTASGNVISQVQFAALRIPTNVPLDFRIDASAFSQVTGAFGGPVRGNGTATISSLQFLRFPLGGPIFNLPSGVTGDDVSRAIKDNRFITGGTLSEDPSVGATTGGGPNGTVPNGGSPVIPEPSTYALLLSGFLGLWFFSRRQWPSGERDGQEDFQPSWLDYQLG